MQVKTQEKKDNKKDKQADIDTKPLHTAETLTNARRYAVWCNNQI